MIEFSEDGLKAQMAEQTPTETRIRWEGGVGEGESKRRVLAISASLSTDGAKHTFWIRTRLNRVQKLHRADVVDVDLLLEDDDHAFSVELDSEDAGREEQLADGRLTLQASEQVHKSAKRTAQQRRKRHELRTLVLTIMSLRGLSLPADLPGPDPEAPSAPGAPTSATNEVQKSISTMPVGPSGLEWTRPYGSQLRIW